MLVRSLYQKMLFCLLCGLFFSSCCTEEKEKIRELESLLLEYDKPLFNNEFATGYILSLPKFGDYGMLELRDGNVHKESFIAMYDEKDFVNSVEGEKYFVRVHSVKGLPLVVEAKKSLNSTDLLFTGTPITNLDFHSLSDHGNDAGWHVKAHRIINGFTLDNKLKIRTSDGELHEYKVPSNLLDMARAISSSQGNGKVYYELNSTEDTYIQLDSVHRHGNVIYD